MSKRKNNDLSKKSSAINTKIKNHIRRNDEIDDLIEYGKPYNIYLEEQEYNKYLRHHFNKIINQKKLFEIVLNRIEKEFNDEKFIAVREWYRYIDQYEFSSSSKKNEGEYTKKINFMFAEEYKKINSSNFKNFTENDDYHYCGNGGQNFRWVKLNMLLTCFVQYLSYLSNPRSKTKFEEGYKDFLKNWYLEDFNLENCFKKWIGLIKVKLEKNLTQNNQDKESRNMLLNESNISSVDNNKIKNKDKNKDKNIYVKNDHLDDFIIPSHNFNIVSNDDKEIKYKADCFKLPSKVRVHEKNITSSVKHDIKATDICNFDLESTNICNFNLESNYFPTFTFPDPTNINFDFNCSYTTSEFKPCISEFDKISKMTNTEKMEKEIPLSYKELSNWEIENNHNYVNIKQKYSVDKSESKFQNVKSYLVKHDEEYSLVNVQPGEMIDGIEIIGSIQEDS